MKTAQLGTLGRFLFAIPFGILGINHFIMSDYYLGMLTSFIPGMGFSIFLVGIALVSSSVLIIINRWVKASCWTLAVLLLLFIAFIHIPNLFDKERHLIAIIELMKDTALMGGALMIAGMVPNDKEL